MRAAVAAGVVGLALWASVAQAASSKSVELATLTECTETFVGLSSGLSLTTIACGSEIVTLAGHGRDAQAGPWNDNDSSEPIQQLIGENGHTDIVWALTNSRRLAARLRAAGIPAVIASDLAFAGCTTAACTGQRVSASWNTPQGLSSFTLSLMQPQGGVNTPSHRHDYVWWSSEKWVWFEHGEAQEQGGTAEITASGDAAEQAGGERVQGFGFVQRGMTTVLHVAR
jgi:hypothetical protein